ncbi:hypothetical protein ESCO_000867 [Escovopsis weberi]|uniref:Uncharacterized protein n=1 Tax=Escovopsis weberi TaxID=150374 RepID=A0A0M8N327_ESCWE|nr:hypothetical protein ESCO_000867 [Escovopsis weberi]
MCHLWRIVCSQCSSPSQGFITSCPLSSTSSCHGPTSTTTIPLQSFCQPCFDARHRITPSMLPHGPSSSPSSSPPSPSPLRIRTTHTGKLPSPEPPCKRRRRALPRVLRILRILRILARSHCPQYRHRDDDDDDDGSSSSSATSSSTSSRHSCSSLSTLSSRGPVPHGGDNAAVGFHAGPGPAPRRARPFTTFTDIISDMTASSAAGRRH